MTTATWDVPQLEDGKSASVTLALAGVLLGTPLSVGFSAPLPPGVLLSANMIADGVAAVVMMNLAGFAINVSGTVTVTYAAMVQVNAQTNTTYTLGLSDAGKVVECTNENECTLTVPANATVAFPVGTVIGLRQGGAGRLNISADGGVTIHSIGNSFSSEGQYAHMALEKTDTNIWVLMGDLSKD